MICFSAIWNCLFNSKTKIRTQLLVAFFCFIFFTIGCTLCVCLQISYSMSNKANDYASSSIYDLNVQSSQTTSRILAESVSQSLKLVGDFTLTTALFTSLILNPHHIELSNQKSLPSSVLSSPSVFKEYNFVAGCQYPSCPVDYGPLAGRSRISKLSNENGSMYNSSVYLFSSLKYAARNDSAWNSIINRNSNVRRIINTLGIFDDEFSTMYQKATNTSSSMMYISLNVDDGSDEYFNIFCAYPGVQKNSTRFDLLKRKWFVQAPINGVYMYGPYLDFFTSDILFSLSSRREIQLSGTKIVIVALVDNLLTEFERIIHSISYPSNGFGAVIAADGSNLVLAWKEGVTINNATHIKTVRELDPYLAAYDLTQNRTISYRDGNGDEWLVSCTPFYNSTSYTTKKSAYAFMILVWVKYSVASASLVDLKHATDRSANNILTFDLIVTFVVAAVVYLLVAATSLRLQPIDNIIGIAKSVVALQAEEEIDRDYKAVMQQSESLKCYRQDEIGLLAIEFAQVVSMLNAESQDKLTHQKYPDNPFYWARSWDATPSWDDFLLYFKLDVIRSTKAGPSAPPLAPPPLVVVEDARSNPLGAMARRARGGAGGSDIITAVKFPPPPPADSTKATSSTPNGVTTDSGAAGPSNEGKSEKDPSFSPISVKWFLSFKTPLYGAVVLLVAGIAAAMVFTVVTMSEAGEGWMTSTTSSIDEQNTANMKVITIAKSTYIKLYFQELTLQTLLGASFTTKLLNGDLLLPSWEKNGSYLTSYSVDPYNTYTSSTSPTNSYSGYYLSESAKCSSYGTCKKYQDLEITRKTSLLDLKYLSYMYYTSVVSNIQLSMKNSSFTRIAPYFYHPYSDETVCIISDQTYKFCAQQYANSRCSGSNSYSTYPNYDSRCRTFYHVGINGGDPSKVYFTLPRYTVTNPSLQMAAVIPIESASDQSITGVVAYNFEVTSLSDAVNAIKILTNGYCYLVERSNTTLVIMHPNFNQKATCFTVSCLETGFSTKEYADFEESVLLPLQSTGSTAENYYTKGGSEWRLEYHEVTVGTIDYILIATVPQSDVDETSDAVKASIDRAVRTMVIALAVSGSVLFLLIVLVARLVVGSVTSPLLKLWELCRAVRQHDLTFQVPEKASSKDMKVLLEAFSSLLISIRFSSTTGDTIRDSPEACKEIFAQALAIFQTTANQRGVGACHNNLGSVHFSKGNFAIAAAHFNKSIVIALELQAKATSDREKKSLSKILSDRVYNSALVLIEESRFPEAFAKLEKAIADDLQNGYIRGCVSKQMAMGQLQLKQGEVSTAQKLFEDALLFFSGDNDLVGLLEPHEAMITHQLALRNMGWFYQSLKNFAMAEVFYLQALCFYTLMATTTTRKTLLSLIDMFEEQGQVQRAEAINSLSTRLGFNLAEMKSQSKNGGAKSVIFCMDYSGSMSGFKIRTAVSSLLDLFDKYIHDHDSCALLVFNMVVHVPQLLCEKRAVATSMRNEIIALTKPNGGTALYQAIQTAISKKFATSNYRWVVVLTDGQDTNSSGVSLPKLSSELLGRKDIGLVIIGVGDDVMADILLSLCNCVKDKDGCQRGYFIPASADVVGIQEAFAKTASIIQADVIYQDL